MQQEAVILRNAVKNYGEEKILNGLNMTVSRGSIYGLLGASGCGKTTLLSCVIGVRYLDSGEVWVLGGKPGCKSSGIPGPRVGYMPQETSLVGEFSVSDAFYYFGRINGLNDEEIETRQRFFLDLLQLPQTDCLVKHMSGGQQRRLSFAVTLIHKPELLILDEPTVGLDPILRENIWAYLIQITQEEGITVLITTHYIEETKNANKIGLMRSGQLLAELAPQELLERFQCSFLDEAFLKLCEAQNNTVTLNEAHGSIDIDNILYQDQNIHEQTQVISEYKKVSKRQVSRFKKFKALLVKNGIQFLRHYAGLVSAILSPIVLVGAFILAIGQDPKDLKIGVINDEAGNCDYGINFGNVWNDEIICHFSNLSCRFLNNFDDSIAIQEYYDDVSEASHAVQNGKLSGLIYFSQNFSEALQIRVEDANFAKDSDLFTSEIQVFLDMSDIQIGLFIQKKLFERFLKVYEDIMRDCKYSPKLAHPPIRFEKPVYGTTELNFPDFVVPSYLLIVNFVLSAIVSAFLIIADRLEGVWVRSVVQGVKKEEILLSHILIQSIIVVVYTAVITLLVFPIWGLECKGPIFAVIILTFLSGFNGLMYGFIVSIICTNHIMATYCVTGVLFPIVLVSGSVWPIEGMPRILRWFSYIMPITLPSISMRGIIYKGYSISESEVYNGFLISIIWILLFFIVIIFGIRSKFS